MQCCVFVSAFSAKTTSDILHVRGVMQLHRICANARVKRQVYGVSKQTDVEADERIHEHDYTPPPSTFR